jgi:alpha-tubulin suppressor-like RCC1 family protein
LPNDTGDESDVGVLDTFAGPDAAETYEEPDYGLPDIPELPLDGSCVAGRTLCGSSCIDLTSDIDNCGSCDAQCAYGASCVTSACKCDAAGQAACAGRCIDVQSDIYNCGACNKVCAISCAGGACLGAEDAASGSGHVCARLTDGTVRCWGLSTDGQLGYSPSSSCDIPGATVPCELRPKPVTGLSGVAQIAAGYRASCARMLDGTVRCWGANARGQLGTGTTMPSATPVAVVGLTGVLELAMSGDFACARLSDGSVKCWGENASGQLGYATASGYSATPTTVPGVSSVQQIAVGFADTCAVRTDGRVFCWGLNDHGQLGIGDTAKHPSPTLLAFTSVSRMALGFHHSCALITGGSVQCWGEARYGALGDFSDTTNTGDTLAPTVLSLSNVAQIAAGWTHTCAAATDGTVSCWGATSIDGAGLPLGFDAPNTCIATSGTLIRCSRYPSAVPLTMPVAQLVAGSSHTCARSAGGAMVCWGWNAAGQLGLGTKSLEERPTAVAW